MNAAEVLYCRARASLGGSTATLSNSQRKKWEEKIQRKVRVQKNSLAKDARVPDFWGGVVRDYFELSY